jgi:hypothetical protein
LETYRTILFGKGGRAKADGSDDWGGLTTLRGLRRAVFG